MRLYNSVAPGEGCEGRPPVAGGTALRHEGTQGLPERSEARKQPDPASPREERAGRCGDTPQYSIYSTDYQAVCGFSCVTVKKN
ncbi:MAG: hypothetical protein NZM35_00675 [Chitinophagales bacterium]|nr:hypothetical protein [Chitinophagales bacterium]MDW8418358.1 hypothetical protein [Chitinophagales bacterium]